MMNRTVSYWCFLLVVAILLVFQFSLAVRNLTIVDVRDALGSVVNNTTGSTTYDGDDSQINTQDTTPRSRMNTYKKDTHNSIHDDNSPKQEYPNLSYLSNTTSIQQRRVIWTNLSLYSGAYLIPVQYLSSLPTEKIDNLESATFQVIRSQRQHARMSLDWLDFSVEHLSGWIKTMDLFNDTHNDVAIVKLLTNLERYIRETPAKVNRLSLVPSLPFLDDDSLEVLKSPKDTVAAITPTTKSATSDTRILSTTKSSQQQQLPILHRTIGVIAAGTWYDRSSKVGIKRSQNVTVSVMGGTIASMMRAGFGRIVLVTATPEDALASQKTIAMIRRQFESYQAESTSSKTASEKNGNNGDNILATTNTELSYVIATKELYQAQAVKIHRPKAAIYGIQQALMGNFNASYTNQWLGTKQPHNYWKYVYFTENDLLLQARPSALPSMHQALEDGLVLFPYRLLKLPHELDLTNAEGTKYNGTNIILPAKYDNILSLNGEEDMCCDGGKDDPEWNIATKVPGEKGCRTFFWACGFLNHTMNSKLTDDHKHRRVLKHAPFYRIEQGSNIVTIPATKHRRCHPRKRKSPEDVCETAPDLERDTRRRRKRKRKRKG